MSTRRIPGLLVVVAVGVMLAMYLGSTVPRGSAASVTGVTNAKFGANQAFAVQRNPAWPTCSDTTTPPTFDSFTVSPNAPPYDAPYSDTTGGPVPLGTNYLMIRDSGNTDYPWAIAMYNASGDELRWNGAWVTAAQVGGTFTTEKIFTEKGQIYGADSQGFLHDSLNGYGTFFSPNSVLDTSRTYTPTSSYNVCIDKYGSGLRAIGANLGTLPVSDTPITPTTSTSSSSTSSTSTSTSSTSSTTTTTAPSSVIVTSVRPTRGPVSGNLRVHIYGSGFAAPSTVSLGGVPCRNVVIKRGRRIDCTTGARAAGVVDVVVTAPGGTGTLPSGYRYG